MRYLIVTMAALAVLAGASVTAQRKPYRGVNDTYAPPQFASRAGWNIRAAHLRELVLASAGLLPMPDRTPLNAQVFGEITHPDYTVSKVYFESLPGFFVAGNLYRPIGDGPFPAILSPHGHWAYGRLENSVTASVPGRAISLARQGFVVFTYDMVGYNDSWQLEHRALRRPAREAVGTERCRPSVVERHSRARLSRIVALRASATKSARLEHRAAARRSSCSLPSTSG